MDPKLISRAIKDQVESFLREDGLLANLAYLSSLPQAEVECYLLVKSEAFLAGTPWFVEVFHRLGATSFAPSSLLELEGEMLPPGKQIPVGALPFALAISGERVALNLLQRASSIATLTRRLVDKAQRRGIAILDTRKCTPGLRQLEKYAVYQGGGSNHRRGQTDAWMVKDNHKAFFGGLTPAVDFFRKQRAFYTPLIVEIDELSEIGEAVDLGIKHLMLDNFTPSQIHQALREKPRGVSFEVSGGITLDNIDHYLIEGLDAISLGGLTSAPPPVDISFKCSSLPQG